MKAAFDFVPTYCPNCGRQLIRPADTFQIDALRINLEDYQRDDRLACDCGLQFEKTFALSAAEEEKALAHMVHYTYPEKSGGSVVGGDWTACGLQVGTKMPITTIDKEQVTCRKCQKKM